MQNHTTERESGVDVDRDDIDRKARDMQDEVERTAERAKERARSVGNRVSDEIEELIPGDSDHDGH